MNERITCIIIEDEIMARKSLEKLCEKSNDLNLIESFETAELAKQYLEESNVDLLLLDIEMPGMSGIELLDNIPYIPQVIFTTSNKEYAYDAYEYDVTDFLKKPITQARFLKAIEKAIDRNRRLNSIAISSAEHEMYVKADKKYIRIPVDSIQYFENVGDYVKVVSDIGAHVIYGSLKSIDQRITHPRFLKVHRSFIVNLGRVVDIEDNTLVIDQKVIPISRAHKPILMRSINLL